MEDKKLYYITSIYLNAYLMSRFDVVKTGLLGNGKVAIFYENVEELHDAIEDYKNNKELSEFVNNYLQVKSIIRIHKQREHIEEMSLDEHLEG